MPSESMMVLLCPSQSRCLFISLLTVLSGNPNKLLNRKGKNGNFCFVFALGEMFKLWPLHMRTWVEFPPFLLC